MLIYRSIKFQWNISDSDNMIIYIYIYIYFFFFFNLFELKKYKNLKKKKYDNNLCYLLFEL